MVLGISVVARTAPCSTLSKALCQLAVVFSRYTGDEEKINQPPNSDTSPEEENEERSFLHRCGGDKGQGEDKWTNNREDEEHHVRSCFPQVESVRTERSREEPKLGTRSPRTSSVRRTAS